MRLTASLLTGDDGLERATDPLHCRDVDAKLLGKNPHAGAPRSRQGLSDSLCERRGYRGADQDASPRSGPSQALGSLRALNRAAINASV